MDIPLHQVLFRLAARAPQLDFDGLLKRVVTGVANHYAAVACAIHTDVSGWAAATAEPVRAIRKMEPVDQARRESIEARLVKRAVLEADLVSALDLEDREEIEVFLQRTLGVIDIFAFPLKQDDRVVAVLVLSLSLDSDPLADSDIHGLMACGELLALAGTAAPRSA